MPDALLLAVVLLSCVTGLAWLALAMEPHWRQVRAQQPLAPGVARVLRLLGGVALALSLLLCLWVDHPSMAVLVWLMALAAAALTVAFTLSWRPRTFAPLVAWVRTR